MKVGGVLVVMHFGTNIGYAIAPLEQTFFQMALALTGSERDVHFSYQNIDKGMPESLPSTFKNVITLRTRSSTDEEKTFLQDYIKKNNIRIVFGFDMPVHLPVYKVMREAGVDKIISYYGAPLSSISNNPLKRVAKKIDVAIRKNKPDHFILESRAMQATAIKGRGIRASNTSVVPLGVDIEKYKPDIALENYAYEIFSIPKDRKIIFYAGHMQERKGVDVIIKAVSQLVNDHNRMGVHLLILGNKEGEERRFFPIFNDTNAANHITFGGYRSDLNKLMPSCYLGVIASNGWDSFPRSAIEMQSCGLPLIASNFQGLIETIDDGKTGKLFRTSDYRDLADKINEFLQDPLLQARYSKAARNRIENGYTLEIQLANLIKVVQKVVGAAY